MRANGAGAHEKEEGDTLDAFMGATLANLREDRKAKLQRRLVAVDTRLKEVNPMLRIARQNADDLLDPLPSESSRAPCPVGKKEANGRSMSTVMRTTSTGDPSNATNDSAALQPTESKIVENSIQVTRNNVSTEDLPQMSTNGHIGNTNVGVATARNQ